jgi:hypothetical protein
VDGDVVMPERSGSHGGAFWKHEFPLMVRGPSDTDLHDPLIGASLLAGTLASASHRVFTRRGDERSTGGRSGSQDDR